MLRSAACAALVSYIDNQPSKYCVLCVCVFLCVCLLVCIVPICASVPVYQLVLVCYFVMLIPKCAQLVQPLLPPEPFYAVCHLDVSVHWCATVLNQCILYSDTHIDKPASTILIFK